MARTKVVFFSLLFLCGLCLAQERGGVDPRIAAPIVGRALSLDGLNGSLEYWGRCNYSPDFPTVHAPKKALGSALRSVRAVFADDPQMQITKDESGIVRMVESDVPHDILNVEIAHISFVNELGSPERDVQAILHSEEVRAFMKTNALSPIQEQIPAPFGVFALGPPQLGELNNVTVSKALDELVKVFHGFWVYENCWTEKWREVHFAFFTGQGKQFSF